MIASKLFAAGFAAAPASRSAPPQSPKPANSGVLR